jgi:lysozyme family protein
MTTSEVIDGVLEREGGYSDHPSDRGGPTKYGITALTLGEWRRMGRPATRAEIKALEPDEARAIYTRRSVEPFAWVPIDGLRVQLVDFGILSGPRAALMALQEVLGVTPDGIVGQRTRSALNAWPWRLVNNGVVAARVRLMSNIADEDESQRDFLRGWVKRAVSFYVT